MSTLQGLQNTLLEGSPTKRQDKPSDILAFRLDGVQQPGHVEPFMPTSAAIENAAVETTVIPAEDSTASGPTPSASTSLVPLAEVKHGQIEAGENASGATSTVPAEKDSIVDPAITAAAVNNKMLAVCSTGLGINRSNEHVFFYLINIDDINFKL